jgi:hypothetical protein
MKLNSSLLTLAAGTTLFIVAGCSKQEPVAQPSTDAGKAPAAAAERVQPASAVKESAGAPAVTIPPVVSIQRTNVTPAPVATLTPSPAPPISTTTAAIPPTATSTTQVSTLQTTPAAQQSNLVQAAKEQLKVLAAPQTNQAAVAPSTTNAIAKATTNQVAVLLEQAKALTSNQKYQEALATVTELYNNKLTPEQKQQVDALKNQIQTALAQKATSGAAATLGNLLGGQKQ